MANAQPTDPAEEPVGGTLPGGVLMDGIDEVQVMMDPSPDFDVQRRMRDNAKDFIQELRRSRPMVVNAAGPQPLSDYLDSWFMLTHVTSFPNGTGESMQVVIWIEMQ